MSKGDTEEFKRFRREHARLHDPVAARGPVELVPQGEPAPAPAGGGVSVQVEPAAIDCRLDMFFDQSFELFAPRAAKVELAWRAEGGDLKRVSMSHERGDRFGATVGMEDGDYLFTYYADGRAVPDPRHAQSLLLSGSGVFAPLRLKRFTRKLTLRNFGDSEKVVTLESDAPWLACAGEATVPPKHKLMTHVRLLPERMSPGENRGTLRLTVRGADAEPEALDVPVTAQLLVGGAVPAFSFRPRDLGALMQGGEPARLEVEVEARGRGQLRGMFMLAHTSEFADFLLDAGGEPRRFTHVFVIESGRLPCRESGAVAVTLVTDCYLTDRRQLAAAVPYRLTFLKKSMSQVDFGPVRPGSAKIVRLEVTRSDGEEAELEVSLPESAAPYLECHLARSGACVFRLRAPELAPGTVLGGEVALRDRRSGLTDSVRFRAEVAGGAGGGAAQVSTARG